MTMSLCVCRIADLFPFDIFSLADLIKGKNEEKLVIFIVFKIHVCLAQRYIDWVNFFSSPS